MDVHRPKPFHGWREFAKEVGITVLGVLIALGGEQVVEALRTSRDVAEARRGLAKAARDIEFAAEMIEEVIDHDRPFKVRPLGPPSTVPASRGR